MSEIAFESSATKGRYVLRQDGAEAELTLSIVSPTLVIASHTEVPDAFRGQGVGLKLAERLVADARAQGFKVIPLCPFVKAQYRRHPEWADVMHNG